MGGDTPPNRAFLAAEHTPPRFVFCPPPHPPSSTLLRYTPLMIAAAFNATSAVDLLLSHGADPNRVNADGASVLAHASEESVRALVRDAIVERVTRAHAAWSREGDGELEEEAAGGGQDGEGGEGGWGEEAGVARHREL